MEISEFTFTMAMINISMVCSMWIIKQTVLSCHWVYSKILIPRMEQCIDESLKKEV